MIARANLARQWTLSLDLDDKCHLQPKPRSNLTIDTSLTTFRFTQLLRCVPVRSCKNLSCTYILDG